MVCDSSTNISFKLVLDSETLIEALPRSMQFDRTRGKFDYCTTEFSDNVAKHLKPHMGEDGSKLKQPLSAHILFDGDPVYRLLWVPDGVTFTEDNVHVEFHDPQKYLTQGNVDWRRKSVTLKEAYEHVFDQRHKKGPTIFNDIKFTVPDETYDELVALKSDKFKSVREESGVYQFGTATSIQKDIEAKNVYNIVEGWYALDFDKMTPWECITEMNKKFGIRTWAEADGNLWVGERSVTGYTHIAAQDDSRVWKLTDYNVTETRNPVVKSVIRGGWADDPSDSWAENAKELVNLNRGTEDFRVEAVATTETSSYLGQEIFEERIEGKRDSLEDIAKRKLVNKQRDQQSGYLEINPELSGNVHTDPKHVAVGDAIITIPPDGGDGDNSVCEGKIEQEIFRIVGVQHEISNSGNWNLRVDVVKKLDDELDPENINTKLRYYDPHSGETITNDKYKAKSEQ